MTLYDPDAVRRQLLAHFDAPPRLVFSPAGFDRLDYRQPELHRSPDDRLAFDNDRPLVQRDGVRAQLHAIVHASLKRLDYATTTREDWESYVRFARDRVTRTGRSYTLRDGKPMPQREFINDTREDAQAWFLDELVPIVQGNDSAHVYVLGEPGAGKSTLLKYLINVNAERLQQERTVFSRFEFQKFCDRFCSHNRSNLRADLHKYIAFLLLRDLIWAKAYPVSPRGERVCIWLPNSLHDLVWRAFERQGLEESDKQIKRVAHQLDAALKRDRIDFTALKLIEPWAMALLVDHLRQDRHIALVVDGLDCVALEDSAFKAERFELLQDIFALRPQLTNLSVPVVDVSSDQVAAATISVEVPASLVFVIRENTFFLHGDGLRKEVPLVDRHKFRVGNIDPEVALLNVLRRGGAIWSRHAGESPAVGEAYAQRLLHGFHIAFRHLNAALHTGKPYRALLGVFCGNLRHLFDFLERLIAWLVEDSITERLLMINPSTDLNTVLAFLASPDGQEVVRRRSYRLIEILLFYRLPWFENLVEVDANDMDHEFMPDLPRAGMWDNRFFTGFLDNIFNYHIDTHDLRDDLHPLLEKIRIIQLLRNQLLSLRKLKQALSARVGYASPNLGQALQILVRGQLVRVHLVGRGLQFTATARGEILLDHVARSMTYLEHVYHQTLFPADFLPIRADAPRGRGGIEKWTAQSIRNCFIFLAYMRFVEGNRAANRQVPMTLRIYQDTYEQVRRSIVGIVGDPDETPPQDHHFDARLDPAAAREARQLAIAREERQIAIAREALSQIENTLSHWNRLGYTVEETPSPATVTAATSWGKGK